MLHINNEYIYHNYYYHNNTLTKEEMYSSFKSYLMSEEQKEPQVPQVAQAVETEKMVAGKTVLSFKYPTPKWATWIFRTEFILNKAMTMYLTGTGAIEPEKVKEYLLIMGIVDFLTWLAARGVGIKKEAIENELTG